MTTEMALVETDGHKDEFYCGICGWVDISEYANHGHGGNE